MTESPNGPIALQTVPATTLPVQAVPVQADPVQADPVQDRRLPAVDDEGPLLADTEELRSDWQAIKAGFIDSPRDSVAQAENVIDEVIDKLVAVLRARQDRTRDTWDRDGRDTESLRQALLTYQALFNRIIAL